MNKKRFFMMVVLLGFTTCLFAGKGGRYAVAHEIAKNPSILAEPWFWIVVVVCLLLVGVYHLVKDKDK